MELTYWWLLPLLLALGFFVIGGFVFYRQWVKLKKDAPNTVLVAHSSRVRNMDSYQKALHKLWWKIIAFGIVFTLLAGLAAFGAARPVTVSIEHPEKHNRDIVLCLDASGSMFDVDVDVLQKFEKLVEGFKGERIALTIFNSRSMQVFPLTDDYSYVQEQLHKTSTIFRLNYNNPSSSSYLASTLGKADGASLVGDGLYGCSLSFDFKQVENRSRSIILATDNVVNGKELVPLDRAALTAKKENIRVYGINPGSRGDGINFVPESAITEMQQAVTSTGGLFFLLSDNNATSTIIDKISATETSLIKGSPMIVKHDSPQAILYIITTLFLLIIGLTIWRKM